ncbi:MAG: hypothetical protein CMP22_04185 [Rickettsiales bacterium]|nr:hypothetical protein [Rickettsiales bacterium]
MSSKQPKPKKKSAQPIHKSGQPKNNLAECAEYIVNYYGVEADFYGILSQLDYEHGNFDHEALGKFANKINAKIKTKKMSIKDIMTINVPLILEISKEKYIVFRPGLGGQTEFSMPGGTDKQKENVAKTIENFKGRVYIMYPDGEDNDLDIQHMIRGNRLDWFWKPLQEYSGYYFEVLIATFFINVFALVMPIYTLNVYDRVIVNFAESTLVVLAVGVLAALTFDFIFKNVRGYILERIASNLGNKHDRDLMEKMMLIKAPILTLTVGEKANLFTELQSIRDFYSTKLVPAIVDFPFFMLFIGVIYYIAPPLAYIPVAAAVIIILMDIFIQLPLTYSIQRYFTTMQRKYMLLIETLSGLKAAQMFNGTGYRLFKWNLESARAFDARRYNQIITGFINNFSVFLTYLSNVFIVFFGVYEINEGNLTIGGLIACSILSGRALAPIMNVSNIMSNYKMTKDVLQTIDGIFQLPDDNIYNKGLGVKKEKFDGDIEAKDLSFKYPRQENYAVENISFSIKAGEKVGLVGRTGAGKSTLANIILGMFPPSHGMVYYDGYMVQSIASTELRRNIGYIPQESFFFRGTIKENIMMGRDDKFEANMDEVLQISGVSMILQQTGMGLDGEVAENGSNLSGGQRQAIAIARALITKPNILLMDEPTTGMDMMLEQHIKTALKKYLEKRTLIMITHRTSLMPLIDRIFLLDKGKLVADGPRDEVLAVLSGQKKVTPNTQQPQPKG